MNQSIVIFGAGAWGTALGHCLSKAGHAVMMVGRSKDKIEYYRETCTHPALENVSLCPNILWTDDVNIALERAQYIILAIPTQYVRPFLETLPPIENIPIIQTAKGIEIRSGKLIHDVTTENLKKKCPVILLSGPSFAIDIAHHKPTAITLACQDTQAALHVQQLFEETEIRPYITNDCNGVALGGALKNILAIAAGFTIGYGLGESAKAALLTRSFQEVILLSHVFNAQKETLYGLSGLGDIMLTCSGMQSRNYRYGFEAGQKALQKESNKAPTYTAEGFYTLEALMPLMIEKKIEFPILYMLSRLLKDEISAADLLTALLKRPFKKE